MLLYEIIAENEKPSVSIITEELYKYRNSLLIYFRSLYGNHNEPVLMVTEVFNACSYAKIVPETELEEAINDYLEDSNLSDEDKESEKETIMYNSIPLYNF